MSTMWVRDKCVRSTLAPGMMEEKAVTGLSSWRVCGMGAELEVARKEVMQENC